MAKVVLLDLDDTILDFHKSEACALALVLESFGIEPTVQKTGLYSRINREMWEKLERGELTRAQILVDRFELFFDEIGISVDPAEAKTRYESALSGQCHFVDGAIETLEKISGDYDLYVVSNGTACVQDGRIAISGIAKYFKGIFISDKIGFNKPDKAFFDYCFERINNFDKNRCIIVGDSLSSDILGGKNAGIATCRFNPHHQVTDPDICADFEIDSLYNLADVLEKFFINR